MSSSMRVLSNRLRWVDKQPGIHVGPVAKSSLLKGIERLLQSEKPAPTVHREVRLSMNIFFYGERRSLSMA